MCECAQCLVIQSIDILVTILIYVLNGVVAIWGFIIPHESDKRENLEAYVKHLEVYVDLVSYSDVVLIPLKLILVIIMKWCLCDCNRAINRLRDDGEDVIKQHENKDICDICTKDMSENGISDSGRSKNNKSIKSNCKHCFVTYVGKTSNNSNTNHVEA